MRSSTSGFTDTYEPTKTRPFLSISEEEIARMLNLLSKVYFPNHLENDIKV